MTQNEKALVWIPYRLAWGDPGADGLIPGRTDVIFYLDLQMIDNRWILSWNLERLIWIAHFKNKTNFFSRYKKFPKELIREILSFLNTNFDKKYAAQIKNDEEQGYGNNRFGQSDYSGNDEDMFIVEDSDNMDESNIVIGHRNYIDDDGNNNNESNIDDENAMNELEDEIHSMAHERRITLDDIDDYAINH